MKKPGRPKLEPGPVQAAAHPADDTERVIWNLRQQIAGCLQKIDELETMVYKLAYGGIDAVRYGTEPIWRRPGNKARVPFQSIFG